MFIDSDCWVLFSVGFDKKGSDLRRILANGDRINHAIFGRDELENGINTLLHNGFLVRENGRFLATSKARQFYKKDRKLFEGYIDEWIRFSKILSALPCGDNTVKSYVLSEDEYREAVHAYTKSFKI